MENSVRNKLPEAAELWDYDLNGEATPDNVNFGTDKKYHFKCKEDPAHIFFKKPKDLYSKRNKTYIGCKYCNPNSKVALPGINDFFTMCPDAVEMWDHEQNSALGLDPHFLRIRSEKKAHFICRNGHNEFRSISNFFDAPYCQTCSHSLLVAAPHTPEFLDVKYNTLQDINNLQKSDGRTLYLSCPSCHYSWKWRTGIWSKRQYCPHCGYDGTPGSHDRNSFVREMYHITTLYDKEPESVTIWDYDKNDPELTPYNVAHATNKKMYFKCKNGHEFLTSPHMLTTHEIGDGSHTYCTYCAGNSTRLQPGVNSLLAKIPYTKDYWDYEKNTLDPDKISKTCTDKAYFHCPTCSYEFEQKISLFSVAKYPCPSCRKKSASIVTAAPDAFRFWDHDKNVLDPNITGIWVKDDAYWKCPDCKHEWSAPIIQFCGQVEPKCPSCWSLPFERSFAAVNPEASKLWDLPRCNGRTPYNTTKMSTKSIVMKCINGKHDPYDIPVNRIPTLPPFGCPECISEAQSSQYLINAVPAAEKMWDNDKNMMPLSEAKKYFSEKVWFKCDKGHSFQKGISAFANNQTCPICDLKVVAKYPHMLKHWDFKKNRLRGLDVNLVSASSKKEADWRCSKCGYEWTAQIVSRRGSAGFCPCCENRTVIHDGITDLFTMVPDMKKSYDFEANKDIDYYSLSVSYHKPIYWHCPECGYKWSAAPSSRLIIEDGKYILRDCPACSGQIRTASYGELYPDLNAAFCDELNGCSLMDIVSSKKARYNLYYWHCELCQENFQSTILAMIRSHTSAFKGCSYCAGKQVSPKNSFALKHQDLLDEYDESNEVDPYSVTEFSGRYAWWKCKVDPSHPKWSATFVSRSRGIGNCPTCRNYNYGTMFHEVYPDLEKYYDTTRNTRPFMSLSYKCNDMLWWNCENGHSFQRRPYNFNTDTLYCPYCSNKALLEGYNDLKTCRPDLLTFYDAEKNDLPPERLLVNSYDYNVWWKCQEGHSFNRAPVKMCETTSCPVCNRKQVVAGINDIATAYPKIKNVWDYEKNSCVPEDVADKCQDKFYYKHDCGHSYDATFARMITHDFECLVCSNSIILPGVNSLSDTHPELCLEISPDEERDPHTLHKEMAYALLWRCQKCGGDYHYPICDRELNDDDCPYCNDRYTKLGVNSLVDTHPELAKEFSPTNDESVERVKKNSDNNVKWICPTCGGEYWYYTSKREVGDDSCPYCRNSRVLAGFNSLETILDDIEQVWSSENERFYTEFLPSSSSYALWECGLCHGSYSERINSFVEKHLNGEDDCPYCSNRRVLPGHNSFDVYHPDLMEEWDWLANSLLCDPSEISDSCRNKVWWTCPKGHNYLCSPKDRILYQYRKMESCTYCKGRRIKMLHFAHHTDRKIK